MYFSIRMRLFASVSLLIAFFVLFSWILNTKYLGKYYISQKSGHLLDIAHAIDNIYRENSADKYLELEYMERNAGVNVLVLNPSFEADYSRYSTMIRRPPDSRAKMINIQAEYVAEHGSLFEIVRDPKMQNNFLNLTYLLSDGKYLVLSTPLAALEQSASIANTFFLYTGITTIIIGSVMVFFYARRFTRPILELNDIAQKMETLDFTQKYQARTQDEIGELGESINSLSDQLDQAIGELQEANQKLRADIEQERKIDEMRKEFVSSVSHELKTPLSLIQGYAEGLKVNVVEAEADKNFYCEVIIDESRKMGKLVKDLLDLSQIESGYFKLEKNEFDLSLLVRQILHKFAPMFQEKDVTVGLEMEPELIVYADEVRTEQVLVNYLNNALNHVDQQKTINIKAINREQKVKIAIYNSGAAIPEASLEQIFTSFYKVDRARTRSYGGTGLGLSVVKAIQEMDGNRYGVENLAEGVEFWFELDKNDGCEG